MSRSKPLLRSSLGRKLIMSLTGIFLCMFLLVHLVGNLQLFNDDAGYAFNQYAYFMTHFAPIKAVSYLLYASIIVHAVYAAVLTRKNRAARPIGYAVSAGRANSTWNARNMGILGTIILVFLATHMHNFWWKYHNDEVPYVEYRTEVETGKRLSAEPLRTEDFTNYVATEDHGVEVIKARDLYKQVDYAFQNVWLVLFYVIAMLALAFHMIHGFQSAFRTLGLSHKKYMPLVQGVGVWVFGVIVPAVFALMPLYIYFKNL